MYTSNFGTISRGKVTGFSKNIKFIFKHIMKKMACLSLGKADIISVLIKKLLENHLTL